MALNQLEVKHLVMVILYMKDRRGENRLSAIPFSWSYGVQFDDLKHHVRLDDHRETPGHHIDFRLDAFPTKYFPVRFWSCKF